MIKVFQKKNYYFLQTMLKEIDNFDIISFNIFDTLLLKTVLFPRDILKIVSIKANIEYGIDDFYYIRESVENELINSNSCNIKLDDIYNEIKNRYPMLCTDNLMALELECERDNISLNGMIYEIFNKAKEKKKEIFLISDTHLPISFVEKQLMDIGCDGYSKVYLSNDCNASKDSGLLYKKIVDENNCDVSKWLHIGSDLASDIETPRKLGITSAFCRSPRDCFFTNEIQNTENNNEVSTGNKIQELINQPIDLSKKIANRINSDYTQIFDLDDEPIICADNISMMFHMSTEKTDNIKEYIIKAIKKELKFKEFWALSDVSFSVRRGEKLGLIGLNGSGKSTILKIMSGVMKPTRGKVSVNGSIAPLIELGAGFDMELSARENIYLNGAILGYSRKDMQKYYENIIDFAELQDFQDVAIKNFSSGMIARLGFAIATSHVPDILIIDEILSVGDFMFQKKCHKKMQELTEKGATVLFVSHSAMDIIEMCDRAIWLEHGRLVDEGEAQYIVEKYMSHQV